MKKVTQMTIAVIFLMMLSMTVWAASPESDFEFSSASETITDYLGNGGDVVIPSTIGGVPVTYIGEGAFAENYQDLTEPKKTSVVIPSSVKRLYEYAFNDCMNLASVTIPETVEQMDMCAFGYCVSLTTIKLPRVSTIAKGAFIRCENLRKVTIPRTVTTIDEAAFLHCSDLTIYYEGSQAEWEAITIVKDNDAVHNAKVYYNADYSNVGSGEVEIKPVPVTAITLSETSKSIYAGDSFYLDPVVVPAEASNPDINWSSDHPEIAEVSAAGRVSAKKAGTAKITAKAADGSGKSATCTVTVTIDPETLPSVYVELPGSNGAVTTKYVYRGNKLEQAVSGMSFDAKTNTLTLSKYSNKQARIVSDMKGGTFTVNVTGENHIGAIKATGGDLVFTGSGHIYINETKTRNGAVVTGHRVIFENTVNADIYTSNNVLMETGNTTIDPETDEPPFLFRGTSNKTLSDIRYRRYTTSFTFGGSWTTWYYTLQGDKLEVRSTVTTGSLGGAGQTGGTTGTTGGSAAVGTKATVGTSKVKVTGKNTVTYVAPKSTGLSSVTIPATVKIKGVSYKVTAVSSKAFTGCKKLTKVTIGKNVKTIGTDAFNGCTKLKTVSIPASVTKIGKNAFRGCTALTGVSIGTGLKEIGETAFYGTKNLKTITIQSTKLTKVGKNALKGIYSKARIKVPAKKVSAYQKLFKGKGQGKNVKVVKK